MAIRRRSFVLASALLVAGLLAALPGPATAAGPIKSGALGADISWPQCGGANPSGGYGFGIIGVTGGRPFTGNDCFASQFAWAQSTGSPQMYINVAYGQRAAAPLLCTADDAACQAYNYGYESARWGYQYAAKQSNNASDALGVWWLDVETGNNWSDDTDLNSYVIQGALDYLQLIKGKTVGVYSTSYQWGLIAGSFAPPSTPNWVAGATSLGDRLKCSAPLWPGGQVWAAQAVNSDINLDQNFGC
jgi:hypothetical protein